MVLQDNMQDRRLRQKNLALLFALLMLVAILFGVSLLYFGGQKPG